MWIKIPLIAQLIILFEPVQKNKLILAVSILGNPVELKKLKSL